MRKSAESRDYLSSSTPRPTGGGTPSSLLPLWFIGFCLETIVAPYVRSDLVRSACSKKNAPSATGFYCRAAILRAAIQTRVASGRVGVLWERTAPPLSPWPFLDTPLFS